MMAVSIGILGAARIAADAFLPAIQRSSAARVVGVAARDRDRAAALANRFGITRTFTAYDALLEDPAIDAVYIALPNTVHALWTKRALAAGKHVLCEKPLTVNAEEAEQVYQLASRTERVVLEALMWRFHPQVDVTRQMVADGSLGRLIAIRSCFSFQLKDEDDIRWRSDLGGGALLDLGPYCVSAAQTFAASPAVVATAREEKGSQCRGGDVDHTFTGTLRCEAGLMTEFRCSFAEPEVQRLDLVGTDHTLTLHHPWLPPQSSESETRFAPPLRTLDDEPLKTPMADPYWAMIEAFARQVRAARQDDESIRLTLERAHLIDALRETAASSTTRGFKSKEDACRRIKTWQRRAPSDDVES